MFGLLQGTLFGSDAGGSTSSPEGSRARTSRSPGKGLVWPAHEADCFSRWPDSSERCGHVGCSLRTYLRSRLEGLSGLRLNWKLSATPSGRVWPVLGRAEPRTNATGCGLSAGSEWPTVTANESPTRTNCGGAQGRVGPERPMLAGAVLMWQTPKATNVDCPVTHHPERGDGGQPNLRAQINATNWPTVGSNPTTGRESLESKKRRGSGGINLQTAVSVNWPTPDTMNAADLPPRAETKGSHALSLHHAVQASWPTCSARDWRSESCSPEYQDERNAQTRGKTLSWAAWNTPAAQDCEQAGSPNRGGLTHDARSCAGPPAPAKPSMSGKRLGSSGQLNPAWVTQLQGLPDGWMDLPVETVRKLRESSRGNGGRR